MPAPKGAGIFLGRVCTDRIALSALSVAALRAVRQRRSRVSVNYFRLFFKKGLRMEWPIDIVRPLLTQHTKAALKNKAKVVCEAGRK